MFFREGFFGGAALGVEDGEIELGFEVVWREVGCLADFFDGAGAVTFFAVGDPEVIERGWVGGIEGNGVEERLDGGVNLADFDLDNAERGEGEGILRADGQSAADRGFRGGILAEFELNGGEI